MTPSPPWIVLSPEGPRCTRCGGVWDRGVVAGIDAAMESLPERPPLAPTSASVLRALYAFVGVHLACGEDGPVYPRVTLDFGAKAPACPECGQPYPYAWYRRCYDCKPCETAGWASGNPPGTKGDCPKCGHALRTRKRCYRCDPVPFFAMRRRGGA